MLTPQSLADAMLNSVGVDYAALYPAVNQCLLECECTTLERSAMWFGQVGEESGGLRWMEEIASGEEYEGRDDLGNTEPGDGARFKGRGPIQVTGRHNYTNLSQWAFSKGLVPAPTFFVDNPSELSNTTYGFIGVTWYWTTQRPMNDAADARDIDRATLYVNGGDHGLADRTNRWQHALGMGDAIIPSSDAPTPHVIPRPDFTEDNQLGNDPNNGDRNGDVPTLWLIHTQEPKVAPYSVTAQDLADFLKSTAGGANPVSYHYTIGQLANGHVEVVDVVDTDLESWSVLDANEYSINACFAGSSVDLTTDEWMEQFAGAVDVAAYLTVQDCIKYGIPTTVIAPPYHDGPGISDHKFVTQHLSIGSHSDVGDNFPWPYFAERVAYYAGTGAPHMAAGQSRSIYRTDNNTIGNANDVAWQNNQMLHEGSVERLALMGEPHALDIVTRLSLGDAPGAKHWDTGEPDQDAIDRAAFILSKAPKQAAAQAKKRVS